LKIAAGFVNSKVLTGENYGINDLKELLEKIN
jgi:hypothetical protein